VNRNYENDKIILEKSKRGVQKFVYGRTILILLLVCLQIGLIAFVFNYFGNYLRIAYSTYTLFSIVIVFIVINRAKSPEINLSWAIIILSIPAVGAILYLYVEFQMINRYKNKKLKKIIMETDHYVVQDEEVMNSLRADSKSTASLAKYLAKNGSFTVNYADEVKYFASGEEKFERILSELKKAEKYIFLEYYIIKEGYMWGEILDILEEKVKEGVEVRVMYDGMCSFSILPFKYPKQLQKLGIKCKMFDPIYPVLSTHYNNRDHRKICVIDGKVAFTGGINFGDEYINMKHPYGHWKDTAVMVTGKAVRNFTLMFLQMWNLDPDRDKKTLAVIEENYSDYIDKESDERTVNKGYVIPYSDSPLDDEPVGKMVYMDIINRAKDYVYFMSPYLVLDHDMVTALSFSAKKGVDVRIVLPQIPDKKYAFALAQNHYKELLTAGVRIYEYVPGFNHAKVCISDDTIAVVGTINLDYRSLYLNFECGAILYRVNEIENVKKDYFSTIELCEEKTLKNYKKKRALLRFVGKIIKPLAPLI